MTREDAWRMFSAQIDTKITAEHRRQFDHWWRTRQLAPGAPLVIDLPEFEQIDYWTKRDGLSPASGDHE